MGPCIQRLVRTLMGASVEVKTLLTFPSVLRQLVLCQLSSIAVLYIVSYLPFLRLKTSGAF